jgi:hypothetical protein
LLGLVRLAQPVTIPRQVIRGGRVGLDVVYDRKQGVFDLLGPAKLLKAVGAVNPAEAAFRRHRGQGRGNVQAGIPLASMGVNPSTQLEHVGMGTTGRSNLRQFIVGGGVIAPATPALGGLQVDTVGRLQRRYHGSLRLAQSGSKSEGVLRPQLDFVPACLKGSAEPIRAWSNQFR